MAVIADREPAARGALGDPVRHVQPVGDQDLARDQGIIVALIEQMARHIVDVIVADEQLDQAEANRRRRDRARRSHEIGEIGADGPDGRQLKPPAAAAAVGDIEDHDLPVPATDDQDAIVEPEQAVRGAETGGHDLEAAVQHDRGRCRVPIDPEIEDQHIILVETRQRKAAAGGREMRVLGTADPRQRGPDLVIGLIGDAHGGHSRRACDRRANGAARSLARTGPSMHIPINMVDCRLSRRGRCWPGLARRRRVRGRSRRHDVETKARLTSLGWTGFRAGARPPRRICSRCG